MLETELANTEVRMIPELAMFENSKEERVHNECVSFIPQHCLMTRISGPQQEIKSPDPCFPSTLTSINNLQLRWMAFFGMVRCYLLRC